MKNEYIIAVVIAGILIVAGFAWMNSGPEVSSNGNARKNVLPDEVSVYANAYTQAQNARDAKDEQIKISVKLVSALKDMGIDEKNIQTSDYNVYEDFGWDNGKKVSKGFVATQQIVIKSKNFEIIANIVDSVIDSGALVLGINFELSSEMERKFKTEVLEEAARDARAKADGIASGFQKKVGKLVSVQTQDYNYGPYPFYASSRDYLGAKEAVLNIQPKEVEVSASVTAVYKLRAF